MKHYILIMNFAIASIFWGCNNRNSVDDKSTKSIPAANNDTITSVAMKELKVSAYLIFDDRTISSFDVLNDKTIALWNTIIGAGDAEKPSHAVRVLLKGQSDSLRIKIVNGKSTVVNKKIAQLNGEQEFIVKDTGCQEVKVVLERNGKSLYNNVIPFECGE